MREPMIGCKAINLAVPEEDEGMLRLAKASRRFDQHVEHRLKIEGRSANDLENLGGRRLLLQRFAQLPGARLHLLEQPHVLDGDHGLVGKRRYKFDLLGRKWLRRRSVH